MKRNFLIGIIGTALISGFFFTACLSMVELRKDLGTYDSNVADDQLCTLEIAGGLKVVGFDEVTVSWALNGTGNDSLESWKSMRGSMYKTVIKIPAGYHTLQGMPMTSFPCLYNDIGNT